MTLAEKSLEIALTQNGTSEHPKGSNSGPQVNQYLKSIGLGPGYAWCMAFVYWCVKSAAESLNVKNQLVKTGGVMRQYTECPLRKIPKTSRAIKPGDIFIMKFSNGLGHTGFVVKVMTGSILTIEGNTNDDGSREGYEVAVRTRLISTIHGFIQL